MPREKTVAVYTGDGTAFHFGIPARDLSEHEFDALDDEQKALLAASSVYTLRGAAPKEEAAAAERRIEHEAVAAAPPEAVSVTVAGAEGPATAKAAEKK